MIVDDETLMLVMMQTLKDTGQQSTNSGYSHKDHIWIVRERTRYPANHKRLSDVLKVIYHPLYGMNNYVLIWGD